MAKLVDTPELQGFAALDAKLAELADPKQQASALRASVSQPMRKVMKKAQANVARLSPGKTPMHRTYKGRLVSAGFASRSLRVKTIMSKDKQRATAMLGVLSEAFYAVQFFELGTATIPRQPWLVPAFESSKKDMVEGIADVLRKRIAKIAAQSK